MIFRRRGKQGPGEPEPAATAPGERDDELDVAADEDLLESRTRGPWDRAETSADESDDTYVDLGGLVIKGSSDMELRLQVDQSGQVASVMYAGAQSGLELRAFAAPRSEGIWDEVRKEIGGEAARVGGTATEQDGKFGTELKVSVPVQGSDGSRATQISRVVGVEGPRWLLRGTFFGRAATDPDPEGDVERIFRDVIVVRGEEAMRPREALPLQVPEAAQQQMLAEMEAQSEDNPQD